MFANEYKVKKSSESDRKISEISKIVDFLKEKKPKNILQHHGFKVHETNDYFIIDIYTRWEI